MVSALEALAPVVREFNTPFKVCRNESVLVALNSGESGESQVGKFCTIYPEDDTRAVEIASALVARTAGIRGPAVPTDLHLGGALYTRYGSFSPILRPDRLGNEHSYIDLPDGSLVRDERVIPFCELPSAPNPFLALPGGGATTNGAPLLSALGPGYRCLDLIKARTTGSVFLALDTRRSAAGSPWRAIKQARAHTFSDLWGRDRRDRLRHEQDVLRRLEGIPGVPRCDVYFEDSGDGYLGLELVRGVPLMEWASRLLEARPFFSLERRRKERLLEVGVELLRIVAGVHERGVLHRDISANNVLVGADGDVHLIDFELAYELDSDAPPFLTGTPGFMSANQAVHGRPRNDDDVYAAVACLVGLLGGVDPRRLVGTDPDSTGRRLRAWTGGGDQRHWRPLAACLAEPGDARSFSELERALTRLVHASGRAGTRTQMPERSPALVERAVASLAAPELLSAEGLPLSVAGENPEFGLSGEEEIADDAHRGVAGVLYLIALAARLGIRDSSTNGLALRCTRWLLSRDTDPSAHLPGLYFGRAGWAVALDDAVTEGLLERHERWDDLVAGLLRGRFDWYDVTHGLAGQGLAALRLAAGDRRDHMLSVVRRCASILVEAQEADGSWVTPSGVAGMSGHVLPGFAHGVSGIAYFLATADCVLDDGRVRDSWQRALDWILSVAVTTPDGLDWHYSDRNPERWRWWCHGGPGIALAFLRAFEASGDDAYAEAAMRALGSVRRELRSWNLTQCHGLAGIGEVLLEGWRVLGIESWFRQAAEIGDLLVESGRATPAGQVVWYAESFLRPTADLMQGGGGVVHFLLALAHRDVRLSPPLLMTPFAPSAGVASRPGT
jgi:predicted Ser/Thr protein kinase